MTTPGPATPARTAVLSAVDIARLLERDPPTPEQIRIIEAPLSPLLVVAGAGSGKTETMAGRVVWLIANGLVAPHEVLGLTFTRKAAGELGDRVRLRLRRLLRAMTAAGVPLPPTFAAASGTARDGTARDGTAPQGTEAGPTSGAPGGGLDLARPTVSTYNSYAASLVTDHGLRLGIEPTSRLLGEAGQWQLAHGVVESWAGDLDTEAATSTLVEAVLTLSGALSEHLRSPAEARTAIEDLAAAILEIPDAPRKKGPYSDVATLARSLGERARMLDVVEAYHRRKRLADAIDFGDQVALAARLAREVEAVGRTERARYRVVLLDEYQDTSHAQLELLSALFGGGHPVTAVGDPHQSIYGWRGASAGGLERFPDRFPAVVDGRRQRAPVRYLSTSWRNDHAVLDAANLVAGPLRAAGEARDEGSGRASVPRLEAAPRAGAGTVLTAYPATVEEEAAAIARFVAERWRPAGREPGGATGDRGRPVPQAVPVRGDRARAARRRPARRGRRARRPAEHARGGRPRLRPAGRARPVPRATPWSACSPVRGSGSGSRDLHALAQWAGELAGTQSRETRRGTAVSAAAVAAALDDDATVVVEGDVVDERSIVDALDDLPPRGWRSRDRTHADRRRAGTGWRTSPGCCAPCGRTPTCRCPSWSARPSACSASTSRSPRVPGLSPGRARAHLDAFRDVAVQFSDGADAPTLGAFLAWLDAAAREERGLERPVTEPDPDAVQLITVHAAKGLEWDVVAVAGLTDGVLPADGDERDGRTHRERVAHRPRHAPVPAARRRRRAARPGRGARRRPEGDGVAAQAVPAGRRRARGRRGAPARLRRADPGALGAAAQRLVVARPQGPAAAVAVPAGARAGRPGDGGRVDRGARPGCGEPAHRGAGHPGVADRPVRPRPAPRPREPRREAVREALAAAPAPAGGGGSASAGPAERDRRVPRRRTPGAGHDADPDAGPDAGPDAASGSTRMLELLLAERDRVTRAVRRRRPAPAPVGLGRRPAGGATGMPSPRRCAARSRSSRRSQARRGTEFHAWVERLLRGGVARRRRGAPRCGRRLGRRRRRRGRPARGVPRHPVGGTAAARGRGGHRDPGRRLRAALPGRRGVRRPGRPGDGGGLEDRAARPWTTTPPAPREVQLAVYRLAWSRWSGTPLDRVGAAFCYVGAGLTVTPERLLDESEIEELLAGAATA